MVCEIGHSEGSIALSQTAVKLHFVAFPLGWGVTEVIRGPVKCLRMFRPSFNTTTGSVLLVVPRIIFNNHVANDGVITNTPIYCCGCFNRRYTISISFMPRSISFNLDKGRYTLPSTEGRRGWGNKANMLFLLHPMIPAPLYYMSAVVGLRCGFAFGGMP